MNGLQFKEKKPVGDKGERLISGYYGNNFYHLSHEYHRADGLILLDKPTLVEIKTHQNDAGWPTFPAEIYQDTVVFPKTPEYMSDYLKDDSQLDWVIQVDAVTLKAYVFDAHRLREYVLARKLSARTYGSTKRKAMGILVEWTDAEAGYLFTIDLEKVKPRKKTPKLTAPKARKPKVHSLFGR